MQDSFNRDTWKYIGDFSDLEIWGSGLRRVLVRGGTDEVSHYYTAPGQGHHRRREITSGSIFRPASAIPDRLPL